MQKIKDKSKKIKVKHLQTIFYIFIEKLISIIILHIVLNLLSLAFYLLSFLKFMN